MGKNEKTPISRFPRRSIRGINYDYQHNLERQQHDAHGR